MANIFRDGKKDMTQLKIYIICKQHIEKNTHIFSSFFTAYIHLHKFSAKHMLSWKVIF